MTWDHNGAPAQDTLPWPEVPGVNTHPTPAWTYYWNEEGDPVANYPGVVQAAAIDPAEVTGSGAVVLANRPTLTNPTLNSVNINQGSIQGAACVETVGYRCQLWDSTRVMGALAFETVNSLADFLVEGNGIRFPGNGWIYSTSGGRISIRRRSGNGPVTIEDNNGTNSRNIVTEAGAVFQGDVAMRAPSDLTGAGGQTPYQNWTGLTGQIYARTYAQKVRENVADANDYDCVLAIETSYHGLPTIAAYANGSVTPPMWFVQGEMSAQTVTQRSARADKMHVAPALPGPVFEAWEKLNPTQFFWRGMNKRTDNRRKFGFTADDMPAELTSLDGSGYDLAQVLAVTVARVKQLERELARVKSPSFWRRVFA